MSPPRVLLVAEAANPEWVSVPLVGYSLARALLEGGGVHVVTQVRNRAALERSGWREGREFTALDSEPVARPLFALDQALRRRGLGWTVTTALGALPYYYFEHLLWKRFGAELRARRYDLVHRVTPLSPTTPSLVARRLRRAGVPFVWGPINGGVAWPPGFGDVIRAEGEWLSYVRAAHRLLPASRSTRRDAAAILVASRATWDALAAERERCVYLPENAVDAARFAARAPCGAARGPLRVAFAGRLVPYKGADMLLEAIAPLVRSGRATLDILGDGPQRSDLEALVAGEALAAGVTFAGWLPHEALVARLAEAQVLGFPSIREFGGGVVLEAMALGVVPVVVDYAGPSELVTPRTGHRVPLGSRAEIVAGVRRALECLAADPAERAALGARARERVLARFTWEAKAAQVRAVYDWVLGRAPKPDFGMPFPDEPAPARSAAETPAARG